MRQESRLRDTTQETLIEMSDGNPGGLNVMLELLEKGLSIDPGNAANRISQSGLGVVIMLDGYGIYGSDIWVLYKDMCGQNIIKMVAALRMMQMGIMEAEPIKSLIDEIQGRSQSFNGYPIKKVIAFRKDLVEKLPKLREDLPDFTKDDGFDTFKMPGEE